MGELTPKLFFFSYSFSLLLITLSERKKKKMNEIDERLFYKSSPSLSTVSTISSSDSGKQGIIGGGGAKDFRD